MNLCRVFLWVYSLNSVGKNAFCSTWVALNVSHLEMIDSGQDVYRSCTDIVIFYIRNLTTGFGIFGKESYRYWGITHLYSLFVCPCMPTHKLGAEFASLALVSVNACEAKPLGSFVQIQSANWPSICSLQPGLKPLPFCLNFGLKPLLLVVFWLP